MRFCLKSPAVGSTKRQFPSAALSETEEKARTAAASREFDSAAADGWRTPPARETGTADVGFVSATFAAGVVDGEAEEAEVVVIPAWAIGEAEISAMLVARLADAVLRGRVIVMIVVLVQSEVVELATARGADVEATIAFVVGAEIAGALPPPKENDWLVSPAAQGA